MAEPVNTVSDLVENITIHVANKSTIGGLVTSIYGWFTQTGSAIFIGIVVTILGFLVNYYFQRKKAAREQALWEQTYSANIRAEERKEELHRARLEAIRLGAIKDTHE